MKNKLPFGKRYGYESIEIPFQNNDIDKTLRTELWSAYYIFFYQPWEHVESYQKKEFHIFNKICWLHFFKFPFDEYPEYRVHNYEKLIKDHFLEGYWVKIYEFIEFIIENADKNKFETDRFRNYINNKLRNNNSAFTVIEDKVVPITNETEIEEIEQLSDQVNNFTLLSGIKSHLKAAIEFMSSKESPDYRNSIKESISMVEVISRIIEPSENTLGKAMNKLEKNNRINPIFKSSLEKMYAYTNGKNGIRHAIMDKENIEIEDARFFLVSCSAFTNYLIEKAKKENLIK